MSRRQWLLVGGVVVVAVVVLAAAVGRSRQPGTALTTPTDPQIATSAPSTTAQPTVAATPPPTSAQTPTPTATPDPTGTPEPTAEPTPTDPPHAGGDPRLLYAEFLVRVNDDRTTVEKLNAALRAGAEAQDTGAVRDASIDILDFADSERDWLRDHPPAACYAEAHRAARAMVAAYGTAGERFFDWSQTGGGLAGLGALGKAVDAADDAGTALAAFASALEATSCAT